MAKFIFVTGGVVSGLGKGITAASLGRLLKARGYRVTLQKFDPYFNVDSSNLSPYQHGEIFVTEDGGESDLVIGHYERFIDENLGRKNDITSGQIYSSVIAKERQGYYNGGTVQVVPHITDEIKSRIRALDNDDTDIVIVEIGGTVGDIETHPYLEAIRQCRSELGKGNVVYVHITLVPYIEVSHEQKTKPTQRSVKELQDVGIQPDVIICRSDYDIDLSSKNKMSLFCNVEKDCIIQSLTTDNIYSIPLTLEEQGLAKVVLRKLKMPDAEPKLDDWRAFYSKFTELTARKDGVRILIMGKYVEKHDAYISLTEALGHSGINADVKVNIDWMSSDRITEKKLARLKEYDGIVIPSGFGSRGFEGKVAAIKVARVENIPILMIGLGAQAAIVEFARNVCGLPQAASAEMDPKSECPVIVPTGDGYRKGAHECRIRPDTRAAAAYGTDRVVERHRHKYECNPAYIETLQENGLAVSGVAASGKYAEIIELPQHRFFVGVLFRPEFISRPCNPHPLISAFISACRQYAQENR